MKKWRNAIGLLLLFFSCASVLTACDVVDAQLSKRAVVTYVEKNYGKKPRVISAVSSDKNKRDKLTVYTLRINRDDPVEFTVAFRQNWGNYGPVSFIDDFHNRDVAVCKEEAAKELAETIGVNLETEPGDRECTITLYLNHESQLSDITRILSELDDLYSFVYTDEGVKVYIEIVLQTGEDGEMTERIHFEDFRAIFDADILLNISIERTVKKFFKVQSREGLPLIRRAIYDAWSEETGCTFKEIYPPQNPLRGNQDYSYCVDCQGRGATGWGKKRVECPGCGGMGYIKD